MRPVPVFDWEVYFRLRGLRLGVDHMAKNKASHKRLQTACAALLLALSIPRNGNAAQSCTPQDGTAVRRRSQEFHQKLEKQKKENKEFLNRFRNLPPEERVRIWKESHDEKYRKTIAYRVSDKIQNLLIIEGTDTVPYLVPIL